MPKITPGITGLHEMGLRDWRTLLGTFDYVFVHKNVQKTSTNIQPPWPHAWSIARLCCHTLDVTSYYCLTTDFTPMILLYCWFNLVTPSGYCSNFGSVSLNRPFPLKGHVGSLLWEWKSWFCFQKMISGSYLKQNNTDVVFQTRVIFSKWVSS